MAGGSAAGGDGADPVDEAVTSGAGGEGRPDDGPPTTDAGADAGGDGVDAGDGERLPAVSVTDLSVSFVAAPDTQRTLAMRLRNRKARRDDILALRNVSFDVPQGSYFAIIGRNGAGKSTLLRVLGGIIPPQQGKVVLRSVVTPLLSMGIGFNPRLSGRENVLLGGLASGLEKQQVLDDMDAVIEFSELGDAIDYPIRTYSSGMRSRLAFAVATNVNPDLVLIDEALAAGDAAFKEKCSARLESLVADNCTVVLVTHGLGIVKKQADRCLWLEKGEVKAEGTPDDVVEEYLSSQGLHEDAETMEDI